MYRSSLGFLAPFLSVFLSLPAPPVSAQAATDPSTSAKQGIALAQKGNCKPALPILRRATSRVTDKQLKFNAAMLTARCAMSIGQTDTAVEALLLLNREFPRDPEVLYTTTHFYSELASRASQELAKTAPASIQAQELEAEAFESQNDWDKAAAEYQRILSQDPKTPDIHYRLGRILLSKNPPDAGGAKKEFEEELRLDANNAPANFMLGEIARQAGQWNEASDHFSAALKLDQGFAEAYLALGISLNSSGKFSAAVAPLESYVKMVPEDPAGHYQLATAYARSGHKPEAEREMALQKETAAKAPRTGEQ